MVAEPDRDSQDSNRGGMQMNKEFWCQMKMLMDKMFRAESKNKNEGQEESGRVLLGEKHSRRM
eukprot:11596091-Karenia_brevis.AAC.1